MFYFGGHFDSSVEKMEPEQGSGLQESLNKKACVSVVMVGVGLGVWSE